MKLIKLSLFSLTILTFLSCNNSDNSDSNKEDTRKNFTTDTTGQSGEAVKEGKNNFNDFDNVADNNGAKINPGDIKFIHDAIIVGMMDFELSDFVQKNSKNIKVKNFASKMVTDMTKFNNNLKILAEKFSVPAPRSYPEDKQKVINSIKSMQETDLNKYYMQTMMSDHIKTVNLFKTSTLNNPELKNFVAKALPVLLEHQKLANQVYSGISK
jgi:putative membrane protein